MGAFHLYTLKLLFMPHIYGVCNHKLVHTDVSRSEKGAKNFATRNGYKTVSIRYNGSLHVKVIATKNEKGRWIAAD